MCTAIPSWVRFCSCPFYEQKFKTTDIMMNTMSLSNTRFAIIKSILIMLFIWCLITFQKKNTWKRNYIAFLKYLFINFYEALFTTIRIRKKGKYNFNFFLFWCDEITKRLQLYTHVHPQCYKHEPLHKKTTSYSKTFGLRSIQCTEQTVFQL